MRSKFPAVSQWLYSLLAPLGATISLLLTAPFVTLISSVRAKPVWGTISWRSTPIPFPRFESNENLISRVRIETPFLQVAAHASRALNYNAQDAVKDFYDKPVVFRMTLEICYMVDAPKPNSVRITVTQNGKQIDAAVG